MTAAQQHRIGRFALLGAGAAVVIVVVWWFFWPTRETPRTPQFADSPTVGK